MKRRTPLHTNAFALPARVQAHPAQARFESRSAEGRAERLDKLAPEPLALNPSVLLAFSVEAAVFLKRCTDRVIE